MSPKASPRKLALDALVRIEDGAFAHILVPELLGRSALQPRDRGLVTELVYGAVRMRRALDFQLAKCSKQEIPKLEPEVRAALRLGAYQLLIGVAAHAAVAETVEVVADPHARLRQRCAAGAVADRATVVVALGARRRRPGRAHVPSGLDRPSAARRVRRRRRDRDAGDRRRGTAGHPARQPVAGDGAPTSSASCATRTSTSPRARSRRTHSCCSHAGDVGALAAVREGRASPQDQASQAVVGVLDPQPGERILDLAAAPGGKAAAAAERMGDDGSVVAADLYPGTDARARARRRPPRPARGRARRCRWHRAMDARSRVRPRAARRAVQRARRAASPPRRALARRTRGRHDTGPHATRHAAHGSRRGAPGRAAGLRRVHGHPAETVAIDEFGAWSLADFTALPPPGAPWRPHGRGALLLPSDAGTDGMYVLVLERGSRS